MRLVTSDIDPLRILLVEDSALLRDMLGEMLDEIDGVVLNGEADGECAALQQMEIGDVDLAIVDLELNQGSGFGVLQRLKQEPSRFGGVRAVVFSTHAHRAVRQRCEALGAEAFFDKAEGMDDLLDFVETAVRQGQQRGHSGRD
ncbi:MAG: response regulator transcription factor [Rhodocyclaceae bacterium]|nr:response regulator transcription factor [Rhodocyclaceae bacterium]